MATQEDVKKWFDTCFRPCFINKYNTFIDRHNGKGKNYKNGQTQKENNLPIDRDYTYNPDVILEDQHNGKISYIIEIEGGERLNENTGKKSETAIVRKDIPGAILLADYCVAKQQPEIKFKMLFIICSEKFEKMRVRINAANSYCHWKNLDKAEICSFEDFKSDPIGKLIGLFC